MPRRPAQRLRARTIFYNDKDGPVQPSTRRQVCPGGALYRDAGRSRLWSGALQPTVGHRWIDVDHGVFHRRAPRQRETNKRQPPVPLPPQLLAHLRRWKKSGRRFVVEWNGKPVKAIEKAFANAVADAGLGPDVTPHALRRTAATWLISLLSLSTISVACFQARQCHSPTGLVPPYEVGHRRDVW